MDLRLRRLVSMSVVALVCLVLVTTRVPAQQRDSLQAAYAALGAGGVTALHLAGFGATYSVGQSPSPRETWPRVTLKAYEADIDYHAPAMRVLLAREMGPVPPRGGGLPFTGEQRVEQLVTASYAWDQPIPVPSGRGMGPTGAGPPAAPQPPPPPQAQPQAVADRLQQIWSTPQGFLRAARAGNATSRTVPQGTEVAFAAGGRRYVGVINPRNEVDRVQTWIDNTVLGDMLVETLYRDYERSPAGVVFPTHITQSQGGHVALDVWLSSVTAGASPAITVPEAVKTATAPPVRVDAERIGNGIYYLRGGSHHSVAVEMRDHVVLIEAPLDEARSTAVIAKVKELFPLKAIRSVVNTHSHFDHAGGLRALVNDGATVVTQEANKAFFETAWAAPRTLNPDSLAKSRKTAVFQTFADSYVLTDGARSIQIHRIVNSPHHDAFALVYLPAEKLLIEADAFTPAAAPPPAPAVPVPPPADKAAEGDKPAAAVPPMGPPPPPASPTTINLYDNVKRLKLDVAQIAALHGPRLATMDDLTKAAGK